jgi:hypothetical protein
MHVKRQQTEDIDDPECKSYLFTLTTYHVLQPIVQEAPDDTLRNVYRDVKVHCRKHR